MATTLASLVVKVGADVTGVTAGMNTLDKRSRSLKKQFGSVTDSTLRWQSALGVLAGATGLAFAAKKVFDLGASVEETASKFSTVFGPAVGESQRFLNEYAAAAGLTVTQGREVLATTGAIVQGMGFGQRASAAFAEEVVRLAGDFASFNNVPIVETSRAIQSALTGERESLKRLGVVILEADVQQRALQMTGKATAKALTQQEKATATLALITERAGVAVGDLARTMDSPANRARKLVAEVLTLRDSMAHALLPAMGVVLEELGKVGGSEGFTGLGETMARNSKVIAAWARFAVESFKAVALAIAALIRIAFNLGEAIGNLAQIMFFALTGQFGKAAQASRDLVGQFGDMGDAVGYVIRGFDSMRVASGIAWQTMASDAGEAASTIAAVAADAERINAVLATVVGRRVLTPRDDPFGLDMVKPKVFEVQALFGDTAEKGREMAEMIGGSLTDNFSSAIANVVTGAQGFGKAFASMAKSILGDIARMIARMIALRAVMALIPGFGQASVLGLSIPGRAQGGPVQSGHAYMVGERGPELFVPRSSGAVVPSGRTQGAQQDSSVAQVADAIMARIGPPPRLVTPEGMAADRFWRAAFAAMVEIAKHDGVRFA